MRRCFTRFIGTLDHAILDRLRGIANTNFPARQVAYHGRPRANDRALSNRYARPDKHVSTNPHIIMKINRHRYQRQIRVGVIMRRRAEIAVLADGGA